MSALAPSELETRCHFCWCVSTATLNADPSKPAPPSPLKQVGSVVLPLCANCSTPSRTLHSPPTYALSRTHAPFQCSACHMVRFCSVACQRAAWPQHKLECALLKAFAASAARGNSGSGGTSSSGGGKGSKQQQPVNPLAFQTITLLVRLALLRRARGGGGSGGGTTLATSSSAASASATASAAEAASGAAGAASSSTSPAPLPPGALANSLSDTGASWMTTTGVVASSVAAAEHLVRVCACAPAPACVLHAYACDERVRACARVDAVCRTCFCAQAEPWRTMLYSHIRNGSFFRPPLTPHAICLSRACACACRSRTLRASPSGGRSASRT